MGIGLKMGVTATSARDGTNSGVMIATAQQIKYRAEIQGEIQVLVYFFTDFATGSVNILINILCVLT